MEQKKAKEIYSKAIEGIKLKPNENVASITELGNGNYYVWLETHGEITDLTNVPVYEYDPNTSKFTAIDTLDALDYMMGNKDSIHTILVN